MSSLPARRTAALSLPAAQATLTARNAGCVMAALVAESASSVDRALQSSNVQYASAARVQSPPGQKRGAAAGAGAGAAASGAMLRTSPSAINADQSESGSTGVPSQPSHPLPRPRPIASNDR